jgi:dephospho-CoA kinase
LQKKLVIGLLGGIGSGKTLVAGMLGSLGAAVIDADKIGHEVLKNKAIKARIRRRFGKEVFTPKGNVSRSRLARAAFASIKEIRALNGITHPEILKRMKRKIAELQKDARAKAIVIDAPLLLEAGLGSLCDKLIFVEAGEVLRRKRTRRSRKWSAEDFRRREAMQMPLEKKKRRASLVIDNSGNRQKTLAQVRKIWERLIVVPATSGR